MTFATLILCLSATTTFAQQPQYTGGMKYTTLGTPEAADKNQKPIYNRKPTPEETENAETDEKVEEKTPEQSAWDKYKELATGKAQKTDNKEGSALPKAPNKPVTPERAAEKEETQKPTGFAAIIDDYQRSKAKRSQMRSISYGTPEDLQINKPEVDTPSVETPSVEKPKVKKDN